jgi:DNA-binding PadR family transcriptional regulator
MSIKFVILGLLSKESLTGYDLKKLITDSSIFYWSGNNNQIYTSLLQLYKEALVTREIQQQDQHPACKIYTITKKGEKELKKWILSDPEIPQYRNTFLFKLSCSNKLSKLELIELIEKYIDEIKIKILMCKEENKRRKVNNIDLKNNLILNSIYKKNISFYETEADWLKQLKTDLKG